MTAYYSIIESCMQPSGAYAKTVATFDGDRLEDAQDRFGQVFFVGPAFGIVWNKTLQLVAVDHRTESHNVLATRPIA